MRIIDNGSKYLYLPQLDGVSPKMLMGSKQRHNDPWWLIPKNLVNDIVFGKVDALPDFPELKHGGRLEDYQVRDTRKMLGITKLLNANPMGLGKTVEAISMLREAEARNALIIVPKIICDQWKDKFKEWWPQFPQDKIHIFTNAKKQRVEDDGSIWIINYEKLLSEAVMNNFRRFQWQYLIVDEAHRIKNAGSKRTKAAKSIPAARRYALTGTPITRYVDDLWSVLHFLDEYYSGTSYHDFVNYFCDFEHTVYGNIMTGLTNNSDKVAVLNELLRRVSIRNESVEVAHGKRISTVKLPMYKKQLKVYKDLKDLALKELPEGMTVANGMVLTLRMRQLTSWPGLFLPGESGPKFDWVLDLCEDNPGEKIVVFSLFEKTVTALAQYLNKHKIGAVTITGQNSTLENYESKIAFLNDDKVQVLAGTIGAMGQGYDGLQEISRTMVMFDRDWSPENMAQCEDRLHRMGQHLPVLVYYLECERSFDQYVGRINQRKAEDIRRALVSTG